MCLSLRTCLHMFQATWWSPGLPKHSTWIVCGNSYVMTVKLLSCQLEAYVFPSVAYARFLPTSGMESLSVPVHDPGCSMRIILKYA